GTRACTTTTMKVRKRTTSSRTTRISRERSASAEAWLSWSDDRRGDRPEYFALAPGGRPGTPSRRRGERPRVDQPELLEPGGDSLPDGGLARAARRHARLL